MSKLKKKEFKFTFQVFFRLLVFLVIIIFLIIFLSTQQPQSKILGDTDIKIDTSSLNQSTVYQDIVNSATSSAFYQQNLQNFHLDLTDFPQKQIRDFQKYVITNVYRDIINSIDKK